MTGIDRLRALAGAWDEWGLGGTLAEIADQIERELREALKSDASDGSEAQKATRDPAEDVSMSAYDLLPADERDATAWVREHGGLDSVKKLLGWVVGHCSTKQQLDFDFWLSGRVMHELGFEEDMADRDEVEGRLLARLMPEGYEWPRYDTSEPVMFGDCVENRNGTCTVNSVRFYSGGGVTVYGEGRGAQFVVVTEPVMHDPIRKARPAVPAADGEPLEVGQTVWDTDAETDTPLTVVEVSSDLVRCEYTWKDGKTYRPCYLPDQLTHQRPDSWERVEKDAGKSACTYFCHSDVTQPPNCGHDVRSCRVDMTEDLVRRCRALAEQERGD